MFTSLIWSKVILRLISNGMTTPFGIRHVSSTTADSCASPGLSTQKLYLYVFGTLPCTMVNSKIGILSGTSNTHVRWVREHHVRQFFTFTSHKQKRKTLSKIPLDSFVSLDEPAVHFSHLRWKKNARRSVVIVEKNSVNSCVYSLFTSPSLNASAIFEFLHFHVTGIGLALHEMLENSTFFQIRPMSHTLRAKIQIIIIVYT